MMRKILIVAALLLVAPMALAGEADDDRGYMGVSLQFTESIHHDGVHVDEGVGVFVAEVMDGGPAEAAGLRSKDRVVAIDGRQVASMDDLKQAMQNTRSGDRVSVTVERDGSEQSFDVALAALPKRHVKVERIGVMVEHAEKRSFIGIGSQIVEDELAAYFGVEGGILVTRVVDGSPAADAGLAAGDVIVAWGDEPLRSEYEVHEMLSKSEPGAEVELSVSRRGAQSSVFVTLGTAAEHMERRDMKLKEHTHRHEIKIHETKDKGQ